MCVSGDTLINLCSLGSTQQCRESFYLRVGAEESVEEPLDAQQNHGHEEEDVGEVESELTDRVLSAVVPHKPCLVARILGGGGVGTTLTLLQK